VVAARIVMWMRAQLRLGRVAGIPVGANWSVAVIFGLLAYLFATSVLPATVDASSRVYWAMGIIVALMFFAALLAHELAHALVARDYGCRSGASPCGLGGVTEFNGEPATARQQLALSAAGLLTSRRCGGRRSRLPHGCGGRAASAHRRVAVACRDECAAGRVQSSA